MTTLLQLKNWLEIVMSNINYDIGTPVYFNIII